MLGDKQLVVLSAMVAEMSVLKDEGKLNFSEINSEWEESNHNLGTGTFGFVRQGRAVGGHQAIAIKIVRGTDDLDFSAMREATYLSQCSHPNIILLLDLIVIAFNSYLILEAYDCSLYQFVRHFYNLPPWLCKHYMKQLLAGTAYLHERGILHNDLKPQNLLLNQKGQLVIADFGLTLSLHGDTGCYNDSFIQTRWYRAPEILLNVPRFNSATDMWSVGCIMIEMMMGSPAFPGDSSLDQLNRYFAWFGTIKPHELVQIGVNVNDEKRKDWSNCTKRRLRTLIKLQCQDYADDLHCINLLSRFLIYIPQFRISAKQALLHAWF